ncbi:MAG: hypothetical protein ACK2T3_10595 [Candidatus Promineifilaceae bacterium]
MDENDFGVKLLISYNINLEVSQEYYRFVLGKYVPTMQSMGLELSEAWHTAYGPYPNRLIGFVSRDSEQLRELMSSDVWEELNEELLDHVSELDYKVIKYKQGFQI